MVDCLTAFSAFPSVWTDDSRAGSVPTLQMKEQNLRGIMMAEVPQLVGVWAKANCLAFSPAISIVMLNLIRLTQPRKKQNNKGRHDRTTYNIQEITSFI